MRASDGDREHVAETLRRAAGEGRLRTEELEQRLEAAFAARTYGELDRIVADLPATRPLARRPRRTAALARALLAIALLALTLAVLLAVMFALTGVLALWMLWLGAGWWFLGRRRHRLHGRGGHTMHACGGGWQRGRGSGGSWV